MCQVGLLLARMFCVHTVLEKTLQPTGVGDSCQEVGASAQEMRIE